LPELDCAPGDEVVVRKRYSAFYRTPLDEILVRHNIAVGVLAGINTHACIRTAAIDAFQRDYDVILAGDCIAS
jgi:nicotinamidase-related amidase